MRPINAPLLLVPEPVPELLQRSSADRGTPAPCAARLEQRHHCGAVCGESLAWLEVRDGCSHAVCRHAHILLTSLAQLTNNKWFGQMVNMLC